ncbi:Septin-domain-containing protein, partial [Gonapodya prolifera JEL478]
LTIIDTPGFGDAMNREKDMEPILSYIDNQNHGYLSAETTHTVRGDIRDTRVHCVLYFIAPSGTGGLRDLDKHFLRVVGPKANVIPLIAKADTLTPEEVAAFKKRILRDIEANNFRIYPLHWSEDVENFNSLTQFMPFAVIGSDYYVDVGGGKKARGRSYKWGNVLVEDPKHCDFIYLRELLVRRNLVDLIETTSTFHYAGHRGTKLSRAGRPRSILECDDEYDGRLATAKKISLEEMQRKEDEIRSKFVAQVKETEAALREREEKVRLFFCLLLVLV